MNHTSNPNLTTPTIIATDNAIKRSGLTPKKKSFNTNTITVAPASSAKVSFPISNHLRPVCLVESMNCGTGCENIDVLEATQ